MIKYLFAGIVIAVLAACSLPTRAPVTPTSWLVASQRAGALPKAAE